MSKNEFIKIVLNGVMANKKYVSFIVYYPGTKELIDYKFYLKFLNFDDLIVLYNNICNYPFKIILY